MLKKEKLKKKTAKNCNYSVREKHILCPVKSSLRINNLVRYHQDKEQNSSFHQNLSIIFSTPIKVYEE